MQEAVDALCLEVRQVAIPLTDAFALSDHILNSPLGKYDGSVYESYFAQVQASNPLPKVHPYFERLIRPLLERKNDEYEDAGESMGLEQELEEMREERAQAQSQAPAPAPASEKKHKGQGKVDGKEDKVRREDSWH